MMMMIIRRWQKNKRNDINAGWDEPHNQVGSKHFYSDTFCFFYSLYEQTKPLHGFLLIPSIWFGV